MENIHIISDQLRNLREHVNTLGFAIGMFENQYGNFMDKNAKKDFALIKDFYEKILNCQIIKNS